MAKIMNDWGLRKVISGKSYLLRAQTVDRIFRSKFYMGILTSIKYSEEVKGQHVPMITEEQFYKVQAIIDGRNRSGMSVGKRLKDNPDFPLRGVIKCGKCGGPLSGAWSKGRHKKYAYCICKARCGAPSIKVKVLDDSSMQFLHKITPSKEKLELFLLVLRKNFLQNMAQIQAKRNSAQNTITELKQMRQTLVEKNLKGFFADDVCQEQLKSIGKQIAAAETVLGMNITRKYAIEEVEAFMREKFADLGKTYQESEPGERRVLLGSIIPTGLFWQYSGLSNRGFSKEYQSILDIESSDFAMSTASRIRTRGLCLEKATS